MLSASPPSTPLPTRPARRELARVLRVLPTLQDSLRVAFAITGGSAQSVLIETSHLPYSPSIKKCIHLSNNQTTVLQICSYSNLKTTTTTTKKIFQGKVIPLSSLRDRSLIKRHLGESPRAGTIKPVRPQSEHFHLIPKQ